MPIGRVASNSDTLEIVDAEVLELIDVSLSGEVSPNEVRLRLRVGDDAATSLILRCEHSPPIERLCRLLRAGLEGRTIQPCCQKR
jgi:hypothetical protein